MSSKKSCTFTAAFIARLSAGDCAFAASDSNSFPCLSPMFGDDMVLQHGKTNTIWGRVNPGGEIRVAVAGRTASTRTGAGGRWEIPLPAPPVVITNIVKNVNGSVTLYFLGGLNSTNVVQATANLTPPVAWQNVSTNVAAANGAWQFTDSNNTATRFYRSYAP